MSTNNSVSDNLNSTNTPSSTAPKIHVTTVQNPIVTTSTSASQAQHLANLSNVRDGARTIQSSTGNQSANADASQRINSPNLSLNTQKTRKLAPRSRAETDANQKTVPSSCSVASASNTVATQQNQLLGPNSSLSNNRYVLRDNDGRWYLLQTNSTSGAVVQQPVVQHPSHNYQMQSMPLIKPNYVNRNATLGQLARNLAPKPANSTLPVSSNPTTSVSVTQALAPRPGMLRSPVLVTSQSQSAAASHYQGLRSTTNANPQLLTMVNGYYVQNLSPNMPATSSVVSQTLLTNHAVVSSPTAQSSDTSDVTTNTASQARSHTVASITSLNKQPQSYNTVAQFADKMGSSNMSGTSKASILPHSSSVNISSVSLPASLPLGSNNIVSIDSSSSTANGKESERSSLKDGSVSGGMIPGSAQVMFMPNATTSQSNESTVSTLPIVRHASQTVRRQGSIGSPLPEQNPPVFQQQQNLPKFGSKPLSSQSAGATLFRRCGDGDYEPGIENEPPSIECHGETKEAHKVRLLFLREAQAFNEKISSQHEIVHSVDGLEILESDIPFPPVPPVLLEEWMPRGPCETAKDSGSKRVSDAFPAKSSHGGGDLEVSVLSESGSDRLDSTTIFGFNDRTSTSSHNVLTNSSITANHMPKNCDPKKKRKRKTNEVDRLLQMDFGPNQVWVKDVRENFAKSSSQKLDSEEVIVLDGERNNGGLASPRLESNERSRTFLNREDDGETLFSSSGVREEKRKGRGVSKRANREKDEERLDDKAASSAEVASVQQASDIGHTSGKIDYVFDNSQRIASESIVHSTDKADTSFNSSMESAGDLGVGSISLSDEDLEAERCVYCDGYLRVKRLISHPQYCSKKCRKLWKKNALLSGARSGDLSLQQQQCESSRTDGSSVSSNFVPDSNGRLHTALKESVTSRQRPARTLILKMGTLNNSDSGNSSTLCQKPDKSTNTAAHRVTLVKPGNEVHPLPAPAFGMRSPQHSDALATTHSSFPSVSAPSKSTSCTVGDVSVIFAESKEKAETSGEHPRTWSCDEVASWVTRVTGTKAIGEKFRSQDVDGQSLLLIAEGEGGIAALLTQKLLLKLGPVLKLEKALKDLIARSQ